MIWQSPVSKFGRVGLDTYLAAVSARNGTKRPLPLLPSPAKIPSEVSVFDSRVSFHAAAHVKVQIFVSTLNSVMGEMAVNSIRCHIGSCGLEISF